MVLQQSMKTLNQAVRKNNSETALEILVKSPELLRHPDHVKRGSELLRHAVCMHFQEIIELLVQFGVDLNSTDFLRVAVYQGNLHAVECLLKNGAKPDDQNSLVYYLLTTKLNFFVQNLHSKKEKLCTPLLPVEMSVDTRKKILTLFAKYGLINAGYRNKDGQNFLWILIADFLDYRNPSKDHHVAMEMAEILVNSGISVDEMDADGYTLLITIIRKDPKWIEFLIKKGADVNRMIQHDYLFPLLLGSDNETAVDILLSNGAEVNAKNKVGCTALLIACSGHHFSVISLLLRKGADISVKNSHGETPFSALKPDKLNYDKCLHAIVKVFSPLIFENKSVPEDYWDLIKMGPLAREIHDNYMDELVRMKNEIFYAPFSYYCVFNMSKSIKRLALLMRNEDFVKSFESNLSLFHFYETNLQKLFDVAARVRDELMLVETRLKCVFGDYLPELVIKNLSEKLTVNDLPL